MSIVSVTSEFLNFKLLISTRLIKIAYPVGVVVIGISAIVTVILLLVTIPNSDALTLAVQLLLTGISFLGANIGWRLFCESLILAFNIHDMLVTIEKKQNV